MNSKNIFISGAAGMIGSNLIENLIVNNKIFAVDNLRLGKKKNLSKFSKNKNFIFKKKDLSKKIILSL